MLKQSSLGAAVTVPRKLKLKMQKNRIAICRKTSLLARKHKKIRIPVVTKDKKALDKYQIRPCCQLLVLTSAIQLPALRRKLMKKLFAFAALLLLVMGCAETPASSAGSANDMMQGDMMQSCQAMMKQKKMTQQCQQMMKTCQDMMGSLPKDKMMQCQQMMSQGGMMQGNVMNNSAQQPTIQPQPSQTDDSSHAQHHP
jgi:hypothetical protein